MRLFVHEMIYDFMNMKMPAAQWATARMSRPMHSAMGVDEFVRITLGQVGDELMATPAGKGAGGCNVSGSCRWYPHPESWF